jgi:hypothetical protein
MFAADLDELLSIAIFHDNNITVNPTTASLQAVEVWKYAGVRSSIFFLSSLNIDNGSD